MLACTVPGRMSSLPDGSVGCGWVVVTETIAASSVAVARFAAARWAEMMLQTTKPMASTAITIPRRARPCMWFGVSGELAACIVESAICSMSGQVRSDQGRRGCGTGVCRRFATMQCGKDHRHEQQRRDRCQQQPPDHGAAQWRVLFATLAHPQGHGQHADHHGQCGHEYRPEARE